MRLKRGTKRAGGAAARGAVLALVRRAKGLAARCRRTAAAGRGGSGRRGDGGDGGDGSSRCGRGGGRRGDRGGDHGGSGGVTTLSGSGQRGLHHLMLCCFCVGTTLDRQRRIHLWLAAHCACSAAAEAATVNACAYVIALLVWRVLRERCAAGQAEAVEEDVLSAQREEERQQHAVAVLAVCPPSPVSFRFLVQWHVCCAASTHSRPRARDVSLSLSVYVALTYIPFLCELGGLE